MPHSRRKYKPGIKKLRTLYFYQRHLFSGADHMSKSTIQNVEANAFRKNRSEIEPISNGKKEVHATDPKNK